MVAKAAPDGYTLLATAEATFVVNPYIYGKLSYDPSDFTPVTGMGLSTHILVAYPRFSARSVADLVAMARANPGAVNYGTFGAGSSSHLNMELFQASARIRMQAVHYRGAAPMMSDLLGGHVPVAFTGATLAAPALKSGQLTALGVGSVARLADFPDVATIAENFAGFQANSWFGLFAPAATPASVIAAINADVQRVLADPVFQDRFLRPNYLLPIPGSPEQFTRYVSGEAEKWRKVIRDASIQVE
jgi:tripartite-type tricarboxylate transporter receptor subunit TctC